MITSLLSRKSFAASGRIDGRATRLPDYVINAVTRTDRGIIANIRPLRGGFHWVIHSWLAECLPCVAIKPTMDCSKCTYGLTKVHRCTPNRPSHLKRKTRTVSGGSVNVSTPAETVCVDSDTSSSSVATDGGRTFSRTV